MNRKFEGITQIIEGYGFHSGNVKPEKKGELIGFSIENGICLTMFIEGRFFPEVDYWLPMTGINNAVAHPEGLKDKFAGQALFGLMSCALDDGRSFYEAKHNHILAETAYDIAGAMLNERKARAEWKEQDNGL